MNAGKVETNMREREARSSGAEHALTPSPGFPPGGQLDAIRQTGERLLAAADDVIQRTLSGDSTAFLRASRQEGGQ